MKAITCTQCGSNELFDDGAYVVCAYCRSRFARPAGERPAGERPAGEATARNTVVSLQADVQALLQKCRDDPANRRRYANLVLDIDPTNPEAAAYLR